MTSSDSAALDRAFEIVLDGKDKVRANFLRALQHQNGKFDAQLQACYHSQMASLRLRPWECPPCLATPGNTPEGRFLRRMLDAGLSRYEPDPIEALEAKANEQAA